MSKIATALYEGEGRKGLEEFYFLQCVIRDYGANNSIFKWMFNYFDNKRHL